MHVPWDVEKSLVAIHRVLSLLEVDRLVGDDARYGFALSKFMLEVAFPETLPPMAKEKGAVLDGHFHPQTLVLKKETLSQVNVPIGDIVNIGDPLED